MAEMNTAWTAASEDIYKAQQAAGADAQASGGANTGGTNQSQSGGETVTDAEFEEVK
jgi:molecular chaperone DnaK